jgi:dTDP-4-amino-4,6-dideoxygalactose transaminase
MSDRIEFVDLGAQQDRIRADLDAGIARVLEHGGYIMGPEVAELERQLAERSGAAHVVACSSGTDALVMALMAWGVGPGDAVFVPSFTFAASAESVALVGAVPVFVDVRPDSFNVDPDSLAKAIVATSELRPAAVMAVDMFGRPADYDELRAITDSHGMPILADGAQSFGGTYRGRQVGSLADMTTTSFFPAKPLGCYGDGGAIFTDDAELAEILRSIRVHGKGSGKYDNRRIGLNGRLDTIQAGVLLAKLRVFDDEIAARARVAARYAEELPPRITPPTEGDHSTSAWAQYTVQVEDREAVVEHARAAGVPTAVYYPKGLHEQTAYASFPAAPDGLPVTEALATTVLSLPVHPYLTPSQQERVIDVVAAAVG